MVRGWRSPHPLPTCKPAGGRRGGEQPGRRSLEGVGGVMGAVGKLLVSLFSFSTKKSVFDHLGARDWRACLYHFLAELNERRSLDERESFIVLLVLFVLFLGYIVSA